MKKSILWTLILVLTGSCLLYSQDKKDKTKLKIKPALLVIDVQNAFVPMVPEREKQVAYYVINELIAMFRAKGYPVICIQHTNPEEGPKPGSPEFEVASEIKLKPEDSRITKTYGDGFNKTDLDKVLKDKGANTLFLCGLSSVGCVLATWIGAQNHDYKAFLVKEGMMSHNSEYTDNVEVMFDAVGYDMIKLILDTAE